MPIYVVIAQDNHDLPVERVVGDGDRCDVATGVWFVRSDLSTSSDVAKLLEIDTSSPGIVVAAKNFSGFANNKIVTRISAWESVRAE